MIDTIQDNGKAILYLRRDLSTIEDKRYLPSPFPVSARFAVAVIETDGEFLKPSGETRLVPPNCPLLIDVTTMKDCLLKCPLLSSISEELPQIAHASKTCQIDL